RVGARKQLVVEPNFRWHRVRGRYPMERGLYLATVRGVAAAGLGIIAAAELDHVAGAILQHLTAGDEIGVAQSNLASGREPVKFLGRVLHEIVALDVKLATETKAPRPRVWIVGMVDRFELLALAFGIVLDDDLQRPQHRHASQGRFVEDLAH